MSERSNKKSIQRVEARVSSKHDVSMHNAINKLKQTPIEHANGRKAVEESIFHLHSIHKVAVTEKLKKMLVDANPSEELICKLFKSEPMDFVHPGVNNLADSSVSKGAYF